MDFNSLGNGSPFYLLRKGDKPTLEVGVVKSKSQPRAQYPTQTPNLMQGMNFQQVIDVTVTLEGKEETFPNLPVGAEIAQRGNDTFSGSREAMLQAVDGMLQASKKALEQIDYHKKVIAESEKMMETLNPQYADNKRHAKTIESLEEKQKETEAKLAALESQNAEMLNILRAMKGSTSTGIAKPSKN